MMNDDTKIPGREGTQLSSRVVRDESRMKYRGDPSVLNFLYVLLIMASSGCALWQHGDVRLTVGVFCAAPVMFLILFIPYWIYPSLWRGVFNGLFFSGVILWGIYRMRSALPDLVLVECLSLCSLVFISGGKSRDRGYLFFIGIFLIIYGALIPRTAYLYFALCALVDLVLILFVQRSSALAGGSCHREKKIRFIPRLLPCVLVLVMTGVLFRYIFALMPLKDNDVPGYFQTSFLTERDNDLPPELQKWFQFSKVTNVKPSEKKDTEISAPLKSNTKPVVSREKNSTPMDIPEAEEKALIDGNGSSSPPGNDLLYYVKSPVLLYHLVRLYDSYDGNTWKESARFKKTRIRMRTAYNHPQVEQIYSVMKFSTLQLPAGFMPVEYFWAIDAEKPLVTEKILRRPPYGAYLKNTPEVPFRYQVSVRLLDETLIRKLNDAQDKYLFENAQEIAKRQNGAFAFKKFRYSAGVAKNPLARHMESLSLSHYKKVPRKISRRVRELAKEITKNCTSDYEKALTLRNYLRQNFTYSMNSSNKVPPGKEGADYFLFELKKGHCEYFACTLAVLARCVNLPSRVATGYSPGNYNTLNNVFEVYEYHAHAWTQIYVPEKGWLTMDGTPPGALDSEALPRGLGHLRDPFGDEWKISTPELSQKNQEAVKELMLEQFRKYLRETPLIDSALLHVVKTQEKVEQKVRKEYDKRVNQVKQSRENKDGRLYKLQAYFKKLLQQIVDLFFACCDFVYSMWLILLAGVLFAAVLYQFAKILFFECRRKNRFKKMVLLEEEGKSFLEKDPRRAVLCYYRAYRLALFCTGRDRKDNQELLALSDELGCVSMILGESSRGIFLLFYKAEYGNGSVTAADAAQAQRYFLAGREKLLELFHGKDRKVK